MAKLLIREVSGTVLVSNGNLIRNAYRGFALDGFSVRLATGPGARVVAEIDGKSVTLGENSVLTMGASRSRPVVKVLVGKLWAKITDLLLSPEEQLQRYLAEEGENATTGVRG